MKKVFCLFIMFALCLSLCACNLEANPTLESNINSIQKKPEKSNNIEYPIVLNETDKYCMSVIGYDDETGMFAINIKNKTKFKISSYDADGSTSVDNRQKCIAQTGGTHSFAYADIPANEDVTVFSSFRVDDNENWDIVYKLSDNHTFEFVMNVAQLENTDEFWDDTFKVVLAPEMFGY